MENQDKNKIKECHDTCAEYLTKAAELQKNASKLCAEGNKDKAKIANFETMGYIFAAIKHIKKLAKKSVGIQCKCCQKEKEEEGFLT